MWCSCNKVQIVINIDINSRNVRSSTTNTPSDQSWKLTEMINNVWSIKIRTTHNLSLWLYEYFWIILLYGHLVYFILKVLAWEICNMKWGFAKKVIIKSQRQFMYGSNFYGSDVIQDWTKKVFKEIFGCIGLGFSSLYNVLYGT